MDMEIQIQESLTGDRSWVVDYGFLAHESIGFGGVNASRF
jgi:hypothetical protein